MFLNYIKSVFQFQMACDFDSEYSICVPESVVPYWHCEVIQVCSCDVCIIVTFFLMLIHMFTDNLYLGNTKFCFH